MVARPTFVAEHKVILNYHRPPICGGELLRLASCVSEGVVFARPGDIVAPGHTEDMAPEEVFCVREVGIHRLRFAVSPVEEDISCGY